MKETGDIQLEKLLDDDITQSTRDIEKSLSVHKSSCNDDYEQWTSPES